MRATARIRTAIVCASFVTLAITPAEATTRVVEARANVFEPAEINIKLDDTVRWIVRNGQHSVKAGSETASRGENFSSSDSCPGAPLFNDCMRAGDTFSNTFTHKGTFTYYCQRHGFDAPFPDCGMCGRVRVTAAGSATSPTATASPSRSPTGSPTGTASPTTTGSPTGTISPGGPGAAGPGDDDGLPTGPIAVAAVAALAVSGYLVWRTLIRS